MYIITHFFSKVKQCHEIGIDNFYVTQNFALEIYRKNLTNLSGYDKIIPICTMSMCK